MNSKIGLIQFYAKDFRDDSANIILLNYEILLSKKLILFDSISDICVIKIANIDYEKGVIRYYKGAKRQGQGVKYDQYYFDDKSIVKKSDLYLGEDVIVVGYPNSIGLKKSPQFDYEKPLLKRGAIASISENYSTFIIDCPVFHGNSGGPVFLERKGFNDYKLRLIGIVTEYIPLLNPTASNTDLTIQNSSYAVVVPIEHALDLIKSK